MISSGENDKLATSLISFQDENLNAYPLRSWSEIQKNGVREAFVSLIRGWKSAWGIVGDVDVSLKTPERFARDDVLWVKRNSVLSQDAVWWFFAVDENDGERRRITRFPETIEKSVDAYAEAHIGQALFGPKPINANTMNCLADVFSEVASAAFVDWWHRLFDVLDKSENKDGFEISAQFPRCGEWSGALQITYSCCGGRWSFILSAMQVDALVAELPRVVSHGRSELPKIVVSPDEAAAFYPCSLRVELADVEVNLGQLQELRIGDLLILSQRLDDPLQVRTSGRKPLFSGWLGKQDGRYALSLERRPA